MEVDVSYFCVCKYQQKKNVCTYKKKASYWIILNVGRSDRHKKTKITID